MLRTNSIRLLMLSLLIGSSTLCRDYMVEFKGGYFLPVSSTFRQAYGGGGFLGSELNVQLCNNANWYMFTSVDYFKKKGRNLSIADSITLRLIPLALGAKYFVPISDRTNFYLGLGFQAAHIKKTSKRACVTTKDTQWSLGAIGKTGFYIDLKRNFVLDLFFDYSFIRTRKNNFYGPTQFLSQVNIHGPIFGAGLGYRF